MTFNTWSKTVVLLPFLLFVVVTIIVTLIIDPYGDLNLIETKYNKKKFASSYNTTPFRLFEKLKSSKFSLVFGTSRTARVNSTMVAGNILNISSLYANPTDVYHVLRQLDKRQIKNINTIYYLVDTHVFNDKVSLYEKFNLHSRTDYYKQVLLGLDKKKIQSSIACVENNIGMYNQYVDEFGAVVFLKERIFNPESKIEHFRIPAFTKDSIKYLNKVNTFCTKNNIKIKYFTPVYNIWYLKKVDMNLYKLQFNAFLEVIDKIYDFHLVDSISYDYKNFTDVDHFNTKTTKQIMISLENDENLTYITKQNIDSMFRMLNEKIKKVDYVDSIKKR